MGDHDSVRVFKVSVREALELFLRFSHRYWFHEISNQVLAADLYKRWSHQLGSDALYDDVREEARDINEYLDADRTRRSTDNMQRLTVVSACGMVGTVATGFLGMNLFSHSELGAWERMAIFIIVFIPTIALTMYTLSISRRWRRSWKRSRASASRGARSGTRSARSGSARRGEDHPHRIGRSDPAPRLATETSEPAHSAD